MSENQTTLFVEDLAVKNMVKNRKLARHIADAGWGQFLNFLAYKQADQGKNLISINRFMPSSKACLKCDVKNETLTLSDRVFVCPSCGHVEDRDIHAAKNIKRFGLAQVLGSGSESSHAVKSLPRSELDLTSDLAKGQSILIDGSAEAPPKLLKQL